MLSLPLAAAMAAIFFASVPLPIFRSTYAGYYQKNALCKDNLAPPLDAAAVKVERMLQSCWSPKVLLSARGRCYLGEE